MKLLINYNNLTPEEVNNAVLSEYHSQLACSLRHDLECGAPGYNPTLTDKLCAKYNTLFWERAYQQALAYHERRQLECSPNGYSAYAQIYEANERAINVFIEQHIQLGDEPSEEPIIERASTTVKPVIPVEKSNVIQVNFKTKERV